MIQNLYSLRFLKIFSVIQNFPRACRVFIFKVLNFFDKLYLDDSKCVQVSRFVTFPNFPRISRAYFHYRSKELKIYSDY